MLVDQTKKKWSHLAAIKVSLDLGKEISQVTGNN